MTMKTTITARLHEQGNGLPSIGELVYDANEGNVYRITGWTNHGNIIGNCIDAELEYVGDASDISEDEWDSMSDVRVVIS
jgi:hypothetical protein